MHDFGVQAFLQVSTVAPEFNVSILDFISRKSLLFGYCGPVGKPCDCRPDAAQGRQTAGESVQWQPIHPNMIMS
jgi:hypothetical protein